MFAGSFASLFTLHEYFYDMTCTSLCKFIYVDSFHLLVTGVTGARFPEVTVGSQSKGRGYPYNHGGHPKWLIVLFYSFVRLILEK